MKFNLPTHQRTRYFWSAPRNRDLWEKSEREPALVTVVTLSTHVYKPLLSLNAYAQSNRNEDTLVPVFGFSQGVRRSVTADRKRAGSENKIATPIYVELQSRYEVLGPN